MTSDTKQKYYFPVISTVDPEGLAAKNGIREYDRIIQINGEKPEDYIDYRYLLSDETIIFELKTIKGKRKIITIEKEIDQDIGIEFFPIKCRTCSNKCMFCFIDQNPRGLRPDLYIKDEDYRLSFLTGNYITLSGLRKKDLQKIKQKRLSPLYISVHSTDKNLRNRILGNPKVPDILPLLRSLAKSNITMHTQIVLVPDVNDGDHLDKTIQNLGKLYPMVASIAVVPVGLTHHRKNLPKIEPFSPQRALETIAQVELFQRQFDSDCGDPIVYAADELYLLAGKPFPSLKAYGALAQIENGIGMVPALVNEFDSFTAKHHPEQDQFQADVDVVCGTLIYPVLDPMVKWLNRIPGLRVVLHPVSNRFYGESVTVTGLLTASDIIHQLKNNLKKKQLIIPDEMLKRYERVFLDNCTVEDLATELNKPVQVFDSTFKGFWELLKKLSI